MLIIRLTVILAFLPFFAICQPGEYIIKGNLAAAGTPATVYLVEPFGGTVLDSGVVKAGQFQLKGKVKAAHYAVLYLNKNNNGFNKQLRDAVPVYLEAGTIVVAGQKETLHSSRVSGTPNNDAKNSYSALISRIVQPLDKKASDLRNATPKEQQSQEPYLTTLASLEKEKIDTLIKYTSGFIKANPNVFISIRSLTDLADFLDYEAVNSLFEGFSNEMRESREGNAFAEKLALLKRVRLGAVAPDLTLPDTTGALVKLSSFRGNYLLVDVWASWCAPCRKENPNHVRTYQKFKDNKLSIIGVSLDDDRKNWVSAIRKDGLPWTQVSNLTGWAGDIVTTYGLNSLPQNYLLDPNGVIIAKNLQGKDLYDRLAEIFERY